MTGGQEQREAVLLAWLLVKVVALKIDTVVAVPELLREEMMLALLCFAFGDAVTEPRLEFFFVSEMYSQVWLSNVQS